MSCISCNSNVNEFFNLGEMPFANALLDFQDQLEEKHQLAIGFCSNCCLVQLTEDSRVDPKKLFSNYTYFTSTSPPLHKHFDQYAEEVLNIFPEVKSKLIVEVAANDGLLLKFLKNKGATKVLGIDPAVNVVEQTRASGLDMICSFFTRDLVSSFKEKAGLVIANNVLAHTPNPVEFLLAVNDLLLDDGVFVCEVQHLQPLIGLNEWTNVYHEHFSYYSLIALNTLLEKCGLFVFDVKKVDTHGGSLRVYSSKISDGFYSTEATNIFMEEMSFGLTNLSTFQKFGEEPKTTKKDLVSLLTDIKKDGKTIVGYGAPAKATTLLQYCGITNKVLDYIVDEAPSKQRKFLPGSGIPIVPTKRLFDTKPDYILVLAWNYLKSIVDKESWVYEYGGQFITTVPYPSIVPCSKGMTSAV